jgi:hypothetical protein
MHELLRTSRCIGNKLKSVVLDVVLVAVVESLERATSMPIYMCHGGFRV